MSETAATPQAPAGSPAPSGGVSDTKGTIIESKAPAKKQFLFDSASERTLSEKMREAKEIEAKEKEKKDAQKAAQAKPAEKPQEKQEEKKEAAAPPAKAEPEEKKPEPKPKYKVKLDGKEKEVEADELVRNYQLREVSQKRLQEAQELKKKLDSVFGVLKEDTGAALKAAGLTDEQIEAFAVAHIIEKQRAFIEQEKLKNATPEEKELHRLRELEKEFKKQQEEAQKRARHQQFETAKTRISNLVIQTLEQLPEAIRRNDFVASRALDAWQYAYENAQALKDRGIEISPKSIAKALQREMERLGVQNKPKPPQEAPPPAKAPSATPGTPVSRRTEPQSQKKDDKERLTHAQLIRQITLGER